MITLLPFLKMVFTRNTWQVEAEGGDEHLRTEMEGKEEKRQRQQSADGRTALSLRGCEQRTARPPLPGEHQPPRTRVADEKSNSSACECSSHAELPKDEKLFGFTQIPTC